LQDSRPVLHVATGSHCTWSNLVHRETGDMAEISTPLEADPKARLLVVDDDPNLRAGMQDLLSLMGYHVEEASSGHEALMSLERAPYDLMVLDIRMPGMNGIEVMHRARQMCPDLSIIVLTAHASLESAIAAVKSDAADYLLKPINVDHLAATISRALQERAEQLRRQRLLNVIGEAVDVLRGAEGPETKEPAPPSPPSAPQRFLYADPLTLDRQKRLVVVTGDPPRTDELTEGEAAILTTLMEQPNEVFSCSQLASAAMGYDLDKWEAESLVRPYIFRLRRKIEETPDTPHLIRTVRGRGYFLSLA